MLASSLPYIVFESDENGNVTFVSDEYSSFTALTVEPNEAHDILQAVHPDDIAQAREKWNAARATGDVFVAEFRLRRHDHVYRWCTARALPQHDAQGTVVRWTGTITDVHDQRQLARERDFLSRASEIFARQLDLDATLKAIAAFTVPEVADWCQIDLRTEDGRIRTVAMAHRDPQKNRVAQQFVGRIHLNPQGEHGSPYVIRTGRSDLIVDVPPAVIDEAVGDDEESKLYHELVLQSCVAVPLVAETQTLGMLAVLYGDSQRKYSADDMPMLEELGRRAGLAIHRARLFEREHRAAESFQEASLPAQLPQAPGLSLDAFYAPGRAEAQVGGDWYDALRLIDGRIVLSIGDVAGSGLQAAVTMGNMRQIIRGIAQVHADPALMLDAADRALRLEHPEKFVTAFVGVFDPITASLTYASAGHPPPFLRRPDGKIELLADAGLPLGLRSNGETASSTTVELLEGSWLVLYTDGLTEFDRDAYKGEERLRTFLESSEMYEIDHPAQSVVEGMMDEATASDDIAVLVANVCGRPERDTDGRNVLQRWHLDTHDAQGVSSARVAFASAFHEHGGHLEDVAMAEMVFGELMSNAVRYAPGAVDVIADWSAPEPVLHVLDNGPGFRHIAVLPPDLFSESGRGLFIVSALTADFRVSKRIHGGSHARAVLRLQRRQLVDSYSSGLSNALMSDFGDQAGWSRSV
jgi:PAS domain S-box-containing protein